MTATKHKTRAIKVGFKSFIRILNGFEGSLCHFFKLGAWRSAKPGACLLRFSIKEKAEIEEPKKVTASVSDSIVEEFGVVIPIASHKYPRVE